jgi:hypothetical protein
VAWAALWAAFVVATLVSEGSSAVPYAAILLAALAGSAAAVWVDPAAGGLVLVALGVGAAAFFRHPATWALLSAPALLLGACAIWSGRRPVAGSRP